MALKYWLVRKEKIGAKSAIISGGWEVVYWGRGESEGFRMGKRDSVYCNNLKCHRLKEVNGDASWILDAVVKTIGMLRYTHCCDHRSKIYIIGNGIAFDSHWAF